MKIVKNTAETKATRHKIIGICVTISLCLCLFLWLVVRENAPSGFKDVESLMSRGEVLSLMGKPEIEVSNDEINQHLTVFELRNEVKKLSPEKWMVYYKGTDTFLVGLDNDSKVVGKVSGGP